MMRQKVKVAWNRQYLSFRDELVSCIFGADRVQITREQFRCIGGRVITGFEDDPALHRSVRDMLREINIKAIIGKELVTLARIPVVAIDKEHWQKIIDKGVSRIISVMESRRMGEVVMTTCGLRNYLTFWPDTKAFNDMLIAEFKARDHVIRITSRGVQVRRKTELAVDIPRMRLHNGRSLFHILMLPAIATKRRWMKGYDYALTVEKTEGVFILLEQCAGIQDENGEMLMSVALHRNDVLLINAAALGLLEKAFAKINVEFLVRKL